MELFLICLTGLLSLATSTVVDDNVLVVNVQRFDGNLEICHEREVCADVFNFTRTMGDGTGRRESRFIQNCRCPSGTPPCGSTGTQLMFKETRTQSMVTCEEAVEFSICEPDQIAKEQHNLGYIVYYKINCLCPNNDSPGDFRNKMTTTKRWFEMTEEEREEAQRNPRSRYFKCRDF